MTALVEMAKNSPEIFGALRNDPAAVAGFEAFAKGVAPDATGAIDVGGGGVSKDGLVEGRSLGAYDGDRLQKQVAVMLALFEEDSHKAKRRKT